MFACLSQRHCINQPPEFSLFLLVIKTVFLLKKDKLLLSRLSDQYSICPIFQNAKPYAFIKLFDSLNNLVSHLAALYGIICYRSRENSENDLISDKKIPNFSL